MKKSLETFPAVLTKWSGRRDSKLNAGKSETAGESAVGNSSNTVDTQLSTHAAELAEIASAWSHLNREIQTAVLTLVRLASGKKI